ncbi:MAG TPA: PA2779 family protein [Syntrophorhabdaceae bacterium]|nr:PA2779 family protein [Syntrophorhabdaceae bacterium]
MMKRAIICYLVMAMFVIGITPRVEAAFAPSQTLQLAVVDRTQDLTKIQAVLETRVVRQRLQDLGFTYEEINARLSEMTDQQIHSIAQKMDDLKVGKDGALGVIIALLVIVALVIIIINLTSGNKVVLTK